MKRSTRVPSDASAWNNAVREASTVENLRRHNGLFQQILLGTDVLEFTLTSGERFTVPASASRYVIASAASEALRGQRVEANQALEWSPPEKTVNYWWAETLYNFGMLAPEGHMMKPDLIFDRIWRDGTVAKISAHDASRAVIVEFDLQGDHPPVDTVTDVASAFGSPDSPVVQ